MRGWICALALACGGRIESAQPDGSAGEAGGSTLLEAGFLSGPCSFSVAYQPKGMAWIPVTKVEGLTTSMSASPGAVKLLCAGTDRDPNSSGFHYALYFDPIAIEPGARTVAGVLQINRNGREIDYAMGPCRLDVKTASADRVAGSFDCGPLDISYGLYELRGTFDVPLR